MTDPRIEAVARALCEHNGHKPDDNELALAMLKPYNNESNWEIYKESAQVALAAADAAAWRPMSEAPRDRTDILAKTRPDVYPETHNRSGWNNRSVVIRHEGFVNDDFDIGWSVAAPVGYGGIPDDRFIGWQPLPAPPASIDALGGVDG